MPHRGRPTFTMYRLLSFAACAGVLLAAQSLSAQTAPGVSTLPVTQPTSVANPNSLPAPIAAMSTGGNQFQHHRARVNYANGLLDVRADNSSLNQILRDISRQTGMTIVGGVADQRVFGNYGPAPPATVLQTLLDGTNTNMLLKETATGGPAELILTPQTGGVTPPGPNSASYDATENEPELALPGAAASSQGIRQPQPASTVALPPGVSTGPAVTLPIRTATTAGSTAASTTPTNTSPPVMPQPANNVYGSPNNVSPTASTLPVVHSVPMDSLPTPSTAEPPRGIVSAPNPPPSYSTTAGFTSQTPQSSNPSNPPPGNTGTAPAGGSAKTPQQIYEELEQLQKQKQSSQPQSNQQPPAGSTPSQPQ